MPRSGRTDEQAHIIGRMAAVPNYPFVPKSTSTVRPGQFWSIPRETGDFAAGIVLAVPTPETAPDHPTSSRVIVTGLLDLLLDRPATAEDLDSAHLTDWGFAHVKSVSLTSGEIGFAGAIDLALNEVPKVTHRGGGEVGYYVNGRRLRAATRDEARSMPVYGTWGLVFIERLASLLPGAWPDRA